MWDPNQRGDGAVQAISRQTIVMIEMAGEFRQQRDAIIARVGVIDPLNFIKVEAAALPFDLQHRIGSEENVALGIGAVRITFSDDEIDSEGDLDLDSDLGDENLDETSDEDISIGFPSNGLLDFNAQKEEFEKQFIIKALKTFKGRINQTALHANIPKKTLLRKIEKYGIVAKDYAELKN